MTIVIFKRPRPRLGRVCVQTTIRGAEWQYFASVRDAIRVMRNYYSLG